jgi:phage-related protein
MGFFDWISDKVGSVVNAIKNTAGNIYSGIKGATDWVADKIQPIVKGVADVAGQIPVIGAPIAGVANQANNIINSGKDFVNRLGQAGRTVGLLNVPKFSRQMM